MKTKVYQEISARIRARNTCVERGDLSWTSKHERAIRELTARHLPSGSGFNAGCDVDVSASMADRLVVQSVYYTMDEHGYTGRLLFEAIVTPSLQFGFDLEFELYEGDEDDWELHSDYIAETFDLALRAEI